MGVGTREMGYLFGQYRRLAGNFQVIQALLNPNYLFSDLLFIFLCILSDRIHGKYLISPNV